MLKDPRLFVASLFVKKPCRIQGLLRVMPFALMVSSVTQRRLRHHWARQGETVPRRIPRTDGAADLALVLPTAGGDSPRPRDRARPGARPD